MNKRDRIKRARKAGEAKSPEKAAAARENGRKHQMNPEIARIMQERGCSRQRAHVILKQK
jgi:hypothetical protein